MTLTISGGLELQGKGKSYLVPGPGPELIQIIVNLCRKNHLLSVSQEPAQVSPSPPFPPHTPSASHRPSEVSPPDCHPSSHWDGWDSQGPIFPREMQSAYPSFLPQVESGPTHPPAGYTNGRTRPGAAATRAAREPWLEYRNSAGQEAGPCRSS